jgi:NADH-quinone oxidoreductase subunit F
VSDTLTPVLTDIWDAEESWKLATYADRGGYGALKTALGRTPAFEAGAAPGSPRA